MRAPPRRTPTLVAAAFALVLMLPHSLADDCTTWTTSSPEVDTLGAGPVPRNYIEVDPICPECLITVWFYEETNGLDGLQRYDEYMDDTCHLMIEPDTIQL